MTKYLETPPVFVVGPVRSGSTFLRLMLNSHPQISNPGECDFMFDKLGKDGQVPNIADYVNWLSSNRIFLAKGLSIAAELPYVELMQSFLHQLTQGSKILTMNVHRHFHLIPHVFPAARYVRLLRDPRDVANSCIGAGWAGNVYYAVDIWKEAEESWRLLRPKLSKDQYFEIKYEELVHDVERHLSDLCRFLGLEYSPQMMNYANESSYSLPDKNLSYQWKHKYTERDLRLVEGKVGSLIRDLGYELSGYDPVRPGRLERVFLYAQNKRFRILHQIARYGIGLYMENLVASRSGLRGWKHACQRRKNDIDRGYLK